jgi:hypothetical protein
MHLAHFHHCTSADLKQVTCPHALAHLGGVKGRPKSLYHRFPSPLLPSNVLDQQLGTVDLSQNCLRHISKCIFFFLVVVLGFELRASCLLDRFSTTQVYFYL